jgi:tRNA A37 threonylcarbamoyladenosine modification protein TsaB
LDARKKEVYAALFSKKGERLERLTEDAVSSPGEVIRSIRSHNGRERCLFVGDGTKAYGELIKAALGEKCLFTLGESYSSTALAVARLGEARLRVAQPDPPGPLTPVYLRASEAEVKRGDGR